MLGIVPNEILGRQLKRRQIHLIKGGILFFLLRGRFNERYASEGSMVHILLHEDVQFLHEAPGLGRHSGGNGSRIGAPKHTVEMNPS